MLFGGTENMFKKNAKYVWPFANVLLAIGYAMGPITFQIVNQYFNAIATEEGTESVGMHRGMQLNGILCFSAAIIMGVVGYFMMKSKLVVGVIIETTSGSQRVCAPAYCTKLPVDAQPSAPEEAGPILSEKLRPDEATRFDTLRTTQPATQKTTSGCCKKKIRSESANDGPMRSESSIQKCRS